MPKKCFKGKREFVKALKRKSGDVNQSVASEYLYAKLISGRMMDSIKVLIDDDDFLELCYATLSAWGLNSRGSVLISFENFSKKIRKYKPILIELEGYKLNKMDENELELVLKKLKRIYEGLYITRSTRTGKPVFDKLVSFSKALHFLLPDLCMPMDREYTFNFFGYASPSWGTYEKVFRHFYDVAKRIDLRTICREENRPIPKLIDDVIILSR